MGAELENHPLISIVTVSLNSAETIECTMSSVKSQSYKHLEQIIIDGGSTDSTLKIVQRHLTERDRLVSEDDDGVYDAMNKGINLASGSLIGILNSDDWYEPGAIELVQKVHKERPSCIICGGMNFVDKALGVISVGVCSGAESAIFRMKCFHPAMFIPAEVYKQIGLYDLSYPSVADWEFTYRAYEAGIEFLYIDKPLTNFRLGGLSSSRSLDRVYEKFSFRLKFSPAKAAIIFPLDLFRLAGSLVLGYLGIRPFYRKTKLSLPKDEY